MKTSKTKRSFLTGDEETKVKWSCASWCPTRNRRDHNSWNAVPMASHPPPPHLPPQGKALANVSTAGRKAWQVSHWIVEDAWWMTVDQKELKSHPQLTVTGLRAVMQTWLHSQKTNKQPKATARNSQLWYWLGRKSFGSRPRNKPLMPAKIEHAQLDTHRQGYTSELELL